MAHSSPYRRRPYVAANDLERVDRYQPRSNVLRRAHGHGLAQGRHAQGNRGGINSRDACKADTKLLESEITGVVFAHYPRK